jgi:hypothetical protein
MSSSPSLSGWTFRTRPAYAAAIEVPAALLEWRLEFMRNEAMVLVSIACHHYGQDPLNS